MNTSTERAASPLMFSAPASANVVCPTDKLRGIELFAGGGGLLLGSTLAGVEHLAAIEWDQWSCDTLRENAANAHPLVNGLRVMQGDIRSISWLDEFPTDVDIIMGGPPCQPFSMGGKANGATDPRDMFPAMTAAITHIQPRAFVVENVRGLTRDSFAEYYELIRLRLTFPDLSAKSTDSWVDHLARLRRHQTSGGEAPGLEYKVSPVVVDAADYGIPQRRHRVFLVGFRADEAARWEVPRPTHSAAALRESQTSGDYWDRHEISKKHQILCLNSGGDRDLLPWNTVRDALEGLPEPGSRSALNHHFRHGARPYPGHTGSPIDSPSKTLKAGAHGVPGGENMIAFPNGQVRYYSIREAARIQTFPDTYRLHGAWSEAMRQLGNAVPVRLAEIFVSSVTTALADSNLRKALSSGHPIWPLYSKADSGKGSRKGGDLGDLHGKSPLPCTFTPNQQASKFNCRWKLGQVTLNDRTHARRIIVAPLL